MKMKASGARNTVVKCRLKSNNYIPNLEESLEHFAKHARANLELSVDESHRREIGGDMPQVPVEKPINWVQDSGEIAPWLKSDVATSGQLLHMLHPVKMAKFTVSYLLSYRYFFIFMARTSFQALRPLLAFSVFGEVMKMALASMTSGPFMFLFSFVLAFEVFYFFLQCYISYTFLGMFFAALF
eukprot:Platyproteum_vivax@DN14793_c0_g1_i1.p1